MALGLVGEQSCSSWKALGTIVQSGAGCVPNQVFERSPAHSEFGGGDQIKNRVSFEA